MTNSLTFFVKSNFLKSVQGRTQNGPPQSTELFSKKFIIAAQRALNTAERGYNFFDAGLEGVNGGWFWPPHFHICKAPNK